MSAVSSGKQPLVSANSLKGDTMTLYNVISSQLFITRVLFHMKMFLKTLIDGDNADVAFRKYPQSSSKKHNLNGALIGVLTGARTGDNTQPDWKTKHCDVTI